MKFKIASIKKMGPMTSQIQMPTSPNASEAKLKSEIEFKHLQDEVETLEQSMV